MLNVRFRHKAALEPGAENPLEQRSDSLRHRLSQITADQVALAVANLKLRATLHYQSTRDQLTQLYNRRYLLDNMEREFCRAARDNSELTLQMLDVDHFKRFNDSYGHGAGDLVLREVGALLRRSVRGSDIPCRYGGGEFLIVLLDRDVADATKRADSLRRQIGDLSLDHRGAPLASVTASIGIAGYPRDGDSLELLLNNADQALYAAKAQGRDRVVRYDEIHAPAANPAGDHGSEQPQQQRVSENLPELAR